MLTVYSNALFYAPIPSKTSRKMLIMPALLFQKKVKFVLVMANYAKNCAIAQSAKAYKPGERGGGGWLQPLPWVFALL